MRLHGTRNAIKLFVMSTALFSAVGIRTNAHAQVIPTPGFPNDTYKVSSDSSPHFCKLTNTELIYAEKPHGNLRPISRNYLTGVESELPQINLLSATQTALAASDVSVSPDGSWAEWPTKKGGRDGVSVVNLARKHYKFIETPAARVISWAPEADTIICFSSEGSVYSSVGYYNLASGELDSDFHISRRSGLAGLDDGSGHRFLVCFCPLSNHRAWSITIPPAFKTGSTRFGLGGACVFEMYELSNTALAKTGYAIDLPPKSDLIRAIVSPHQRSVIWEFGFQRTTELWISDMNGIHMRRAVTMLDEKNASYFDAEPPIADVMWLPSGPKIGFRVVGTLYIVHLDIDKDQPEP